MAILIINWEQKSSQLARTKYNEDTRELVVEFKNKDKKTFLYKYIGVPIEVYEKLKVTQSIGKFISAEIKGVFDFVKLS